MRVNHLELVRFSNVEKCHIIQNLLFAQGLRDKTMLKEIGKTDSFDRMISALKYSIDQDLTKVEVV